MKQYRFPDGRLLNGYEPFTATRFSDKETYNCPPGWLNAATADDLADYGIKVVEMPDPPPSAPQRVLLARAVIVDRLYKAGLLDKARAALDEADLYTRERWNARQAIYADDATAIKLLQSIGAEPAVILAPEPK